MSRKIKVAALQSSFKDSKAENIQRVTDLVNEAASRGAQIILPSELFEGPYFCKEENERFFDWAHPVENHPTLEHFSKLAKKLSVVLPISFFEKSLQAYFNSMAMIDADGSILGIYRKSHIPDGPGYEEKFYFRPGDTSFRVWKTRYAQLGVGICWDQWFPECARSMALLGAEVLLYPTAIGSEPHQPDNDTKDPWQRIMMGHAVANHMPVVAANRVGIEGNQTFYGSSFIANARGDKVSELDRSEEGVITAEFDLTALSRTRASWGFFRDRRPELYRNLTDGN